LPPNLCHIIRRFGRENPSWGEERIADELLVKFGIRVSPRTVSKYLGSGRPHTSRGDQRWATFRIVDDDIGKAGQAQKAIRRISKIRTHTSDPRMLPDQRRDTPHGLPERLRGGGIVVGNPAYRRNHIAARAPRQQCDRHPTLASMI